MFSNLFFHLFLFAVSCGSFAFAVFLLIKGKLLIKDNIAFIKENEDLKRENAALSLSLADMTKRAVDLEDAIANEYSVAVRHVHNIAKCDFDTRELWFIADSLKDYIQANGYGDGIIKDVIATYEKATEFYNKVESND